MREPLSIVEVLATLRLSRERFEANDGNYATQRECCSASLSALVAYLHQFPLIAADLEPLAALQSALDKLAKGGSHPIFAVVKKRRGAQPLTAEERNMQAFGVALTELLIDLQYTEQDAVRRVASSFANAGLVGSRKRNPITDSVVREWRSLARSSKTNVLRQLADERRIQIRESWTKGGKTVPMTAAEAADFVARLPGLASLRWQTQT